MATVIETCATPSIDDATLRKLAELGFRRVERWEAEMTNAKREPSPELTEQRSLELVG